MIYNNGAIIVEKGGTLIIEENTDAYGHTRSGTIITQASEGRGGRIACEGTIIIMPDCKCFGGGQYGIQLGDGILEEHRILTEKHIYQQYPVIK